MEELKSEIRQKWNTNPEGYDSAHAHGVNSPEEIRQWTEILGPKAPSPMLDVGCGTGFVALLAARLGLDVTGVDWSTGMMGQARAKAEAENLKVRFVVGDTEHLPFLDGSFPILTSRHVIWTLTDPEKAFSEWYRVLSAGGCVYADYSPKKAPEKAQHYRLEVERQLPLNRDIAPEVIADMFRRAGFSEVSVEKRSRTYKHNDSDEERTSVNYLFICKK